SRTCSAWTWSDRGVFSKALKALSAQASLAPGGWGITGPHAKAPSSTAAAVRSRRYTNHGAGSVATPALAFREHIDGAPAGAHLQPPIVGIGAAEGHAEEGVLALPLGIEHHIALLVHGGGGPSIGTDLQHHHGIAGP